MGTFRVEVQAVGNHGCQREIKSGGSLSRCKDPSCVDCIAREFVDKLKAAGASFSYGGQDPSNINYAKLTHWPGGNGTVVDDLLTNVRNGSF